MNIYDVMFCQNVFYIQSTVRLSRFLEQEPTLTSSLMSHLRLPSLKLEMFMKSLHICSILEPHSLRYYIRMTTRSYIFSFINTRTVLEFNRHVLYLRQCCLASSRKKFLFLLENVKNLMYLNSEKYIYIYIDVF